MESLPIPISTFNPSNSTGDNERLHSQTEGGAPGSLSVVVATYRRERVLVDTLGKLAVLLRPGDEIVVVDQTAEHEQTTEDSLIELTKVYPIHWHRRTQPGICQAMNCGARLAKGELLLFVDDDVIPDPGLLEGHRRTLCSADHPPAACGQVLQPWNAGEVDFVADFEGNFNFAYSKECDILSLMGGNFGIRRETFIEVGGIDENFFGACYRWEAEFCHRLFKISGRLIRYLPDASIRHLHVSSGGTRAFGTKDTWKHISGSVGDYYFAFKCLSPIRAVAHCVRRLIRAPLNRHTLAHPWMIPSLWAREVVAIGWAALLRVRRNSHYIQSLAAYAAADTKHATTA